MTRDRFAALQVKSQRIDAGMSPEQLGWAAGVSGHTIRRIEREGIVPTPRVQFLIAQHFGKRPTELWSVGGRKAVA